VGLAGFVAADTAYGFERQSHDANMLRFASVMLTAVAMAGGFAHLFELPNKIGLSREDYLRVQQIYRGWALLSIAVTGALVSTSALAISIREGGPGTR
jgi:hypothetical protein